MTDKKPKHPNSLKNLKPFVKGQSGNPDGLPKGFKHMKTQLREALNTEVDFKTLSSKQKRMDAGEAIAIKLVAQAIKGNTTAAKIVIEHSEDKSLEVTINDKHVEINEDMSLEEASRAYSELLKQ